LAVSFSPNGFDEDRKKQAERCEMHWETATRLLAFLGVAGAAAGIPVAAGFLVIAALGPVMQFPFTRIKNDPPRDDFYATTQIRPQTIDPTLMFPIRGWTEPVLGAEIVVSLATSLDRTSAYLDAMITAGERAMGAYDQRSGAAIDLRYAEVKHNAARALHSAGVLHAAAERARDVGLVNYPDDMPDPDRPDQPLLEWIASSNALPLVLATGIDEGNLHAPIGDIYATTINRDDLFVASQATIEFLEDVFVNLPDTTQEFIAEGEDSDRHSPAY
jgi:hypothetical protein